MATNDPMPQIKKPFSKMERTLTPIRTHIEEELPEALLLVQVHVQYNETPDAAIDRLAPIYTKRLKLDVRVKSNVFKTV